ncbi:hyaluronan-mediated motility receptor [Biomphalaria pfeifferi]|uniref:Hyaluronan-mediated motility receptor n=1 Tax=Biomphalaria pfeifferi TaxID=112525 RepID=A0AAD8FNI7_BIOPF|nr:hyaluronan-mediated motility receptor [Biomphalaria pfeifferi]
MAFPRARIKRFNETNDNIPGVGSYNLLRDHHGPITGYRLTDNNEMPGHIESLHMKLKEAQDQIKSLDIFLTGANKQKDILEKEYKVLEQKLSSCNKNLKELESEKNKLNKAISELQKENTDLESKRASAEHESHAISALLEKEKNIVKNLHRECSSLQSYVCKLQNEGKEIESEKIKLTKTISKLENTKANLEKDRDAISSCLNEEKERSKKECATLMSTITQLQREGKVYEEEKNKMDKTIQELVTINASLEKTKDIIATQLEDEKEKAERHGAEFLKEKVRLNDIIALLRTESLALKNQLTNSVQECQVLSMQLNEKNVKYLEMKSTISRLDEEVAYLENTKASLEMERDSISSSMMEEREKFHNECSVLTSSILELQTTVTNYEGKNNVLNKTVLELQSKNAYLENDMNIISSQLDAERVKSAKKNFELKSTISALQEESQAEKDHWKATISELQNDTIELKEKLDYSMQECQTVLSQVHKERESLNSYKLENSQMKSISLNKQKEIADLKAEIRNLANTLAESEYIRNDLEKGKNVLSSCLADEREQFKKECSIFNSSVAELTQKLEHSENERSNMNQTIQELKTKIVQLEKDKEALSSQLEENDQMERLTKEAIKNMGHQNQRRKVKYAETLKKIAPVMATPELDSSKLTQTPGKPRIPFKGKQWKKPTSHVLFAGRGFQFGPEKLPLKKKL